MPDTPVSGGQKCAICGVADLREVTGFPTLPRVTSDCKPFAPGGKIAHCGACGSVQKPGDAAWRRDAAAIYQAYTLYAAAGGEEQGVGQDTDMVRRSSLLVQKLAAAGRLRAGDTLLDFGSGTGAFLRAAADVEGSRSLYALDLDDRFEAKLNRIPGFRRLYLGDAENIDRRFTVISMIHSLEHLQRPVQELVRLGALLDDDGAIFIQVPDWRRNYFDLLVADHLMHFDAPALRACAAQAGLAMPMQEHWISHELSALVVGSGAVVPSEVESLEADELARAVGWLVQVMESAHSFVDRPSCPFAIFGTAVAGSWMAGALSRPPEMFIDEDPSRVGGTHLDIPIVHPDQVPASLAVLIPMRPDIAQRVLARYAGRWDRTWCASDVAVA